MKRYSIIFLKIALLVIGIPALAMCVIGLPWFVRKASEIYPDFMGGMYVTVISLYLAAIAYFAALYEAYRLLKYIGKNCAFSDVAVRPLRVIKRCAIGISILFLLCMPYLYQIADVEDAPGLLLIGLAFVFASVVIAVFATVLQMLLLDAITIKSENDLTV